MIDKFIERDFGKGFLFSVETLNVTEEDINKYKTGNLKKPYDTYQFGGLFGGFDTCDVMIYTNGHYPKVVRLIKDIPTFDSEDREYNSWHDLYLVQEQNGNIHAAYCTGGYRIASIQGYAKVLNYPHKLKHYFTN